LRGLGVKVSEHFRHGFFQFRREGVFQTLEGEQLVAAVRIIAAPGAKGEEIQFGQSAACIPEGVAVEPRHGELDAIEPPAGESIPIGGDGEKQIQADVLGPQAFEKAFAAEAVVDPGERVGHFTNPLWHEQGQGLFQWHGVASVARNMRCGRSATPSICSSKQGVYFRADQNNSRGIKRTDFKSRWNWQNVQNLARGPPKKNNLGRRFN
jgi:hypothetical protein